MKILVVDDSMTNRLFIQRVLEKYGGHEIFTAENGIEALKKIGKLMPDLVILDIMMPEMDGYEACRYISNNPDTENIPIIILTALDEVKDLVKAFDVGAIDFIRKPPNELELIARVNSALKIKEYQDKLKELIIKDGLTGLYTHSYFINVLERQFYVTQRYKEGLSLIILDIDDFKKINDTFGHLAGDKALVNMSKVINDSIRKSDIASRYGGEEFSIILPHTQIEDASKLAERLRKNIENMLVHDKDKCFSFTVSIGLTKYNDEDSFYDDLIRRADDALYLAKRTGKNKVVIL